MNLREFIDYIRTSRLDDKAVQADGTVGTRLWSDPEIIDAAREAQDEACERADLLRDEFTEAICNVTIVAGQQLYPLHRSVYKVDENFVRYVDNGQRLKMTSEDELDRNGAGGYYDAYGYRPGFGGRWTNLQASRSRFYFIKRKAGGQLVLRPFPIGNVATYTAPDGTEQPLVLNLAVYRKPIWPLRAPTDQFEIADRWHRRLSSWVLARLYEKNDNDSGDPQKSAKYYAEFDASFGLRPSARTNTDRDERRIETVEPWGI